MICEASEEHDAIEPRWVVIEEPNDSDRSICGGESSAATSILVRGGVFGSPGVAIVRAGPGSVFVWGHSAAERLVESK